MNSRTVKCLLQLTQTTYVIIKYSCQRYTLLDVM